MGEQERGLDVYPVGLLRDLQEFGQVIRYACRKLANNWRTGWRRRSYWNGYLAEQSNGRARRAGHGWTEHRAVEDLAHHLFVELPTGREAHDDR